MATLTGKLVAPGWNCYICGKSHPDSGPYWTTDAMIVDRKVPFVLCGSCTTTQLKPLNLAPRDQLVEALRAQHQAEELERTHIHDLQRLNAEVAKLERLLELARNDAQAAAVNNVILERRLREAEDPATGAMEAFKARLAEQTADSDQPDVLEPPAAESLVDEIKRKTAKTKAAA
jgi:hypothetical protein